MGIYRSSRVGDFSNKDLNIGLSTRLLLNALSRPSDFGPLPQYSLFESLLCLTLLAQRYCDIISLFVTTLMLLPIAVLVPNIFCVVLAVCIVIHHLIHSELAFESLFHHRIVTTESTKRALGETEEGCLKTTSRNRDVCLLQTRQCSDARGRSRCNCPRWKTSDLVAATPMQLPRLVPQSPSHNSTDVTVRSSSRDIRWEGEWYEAASAVSTICNALKGNIPKLG